MSSLIKNCYLSWLSISNLLWNKTFFQIFKICFLTLALLTLSRSFSIIFISYGLRLLLCMWSCTILCAIKLQVNRRTCHLTHVSIRLKKLHFHGKWQNHFTCKSVSHLYICRNLSEWKIEFILSYLVRNSQINGKNKLSSKVP